MAARWKPILGALGISYFFNLAGVAWFFGPILANDMPMGAVVPGWVALFVAYVLYILFFDWAARVVGHPLRAALIIAVSQVLLVDVYYVLTGARGVVAAVASAVLILAGWTLVGTVYDRLSPAQASAGGN